MTHEDARTRLINATFDAFGLEEGKAILDEVVVRTKATPNTTLGDVARLIEIVAIERELARVVARRNVS